MIRRIAAIVLTWVVVVPITAAASGDFQPDPKAVQRVGAGYRFPQDGWWVVHIEGEPYERGVQHGRLMWSEIEAHVRCFATTYSDKGPREAWRLLRTLCESLFLSKFDREYLEEMRGIADGATAEGAKFHGHPLDLIDIATLNLWPEIMTLPWAADAMPTGLEGTKFPEASTRTTPPTKPGHCSAFAATGPATADGKIIFGHITMFNLYPSTFYNIWLDVKPAKGHRVLMQSFPGGIHSGMDYYMNDVGILCSETTIDQTRLDAAGAPLSSRIRKSLQYADSIDEVVSTLLENNNGLYTNEWMLADIKTNEIAMFELGTRTHKLYRSSKNEWFGGTEGFYWGCNNTKDLQVRLETIAATHDRPANMVWNPSDRDVEWLKLYKKHKGKMTVDFGREAFTTPPICAFASVDAKFTTTSLAKDLKSWAIFGPPRGKTWLPTDHEKRKYYEVEPLVSHPWTILHGGAPGSEPTGETPADLLAKGGEGRRNNDDEEEEEHGADPIPPAKLVWRGTLLPQSDSDIWLASAFADYHRIVAREKGYLSLSDNGCLCDKDLGKLGTTLYAARARYLSSAAEIGDIPLTRTRSDDAGQAWYRAASGKGALVLNELRWRLGDDKFIETLDGFGLAHAGKPVAWTQFAQHATSSTGENLDSFFDYWVKGTGLPKLVLKDARSLPAAESGDGRRRYRVEGVLAAEGGPLPARIEMTVESGKEESTQAVEVNPTSGAFSLEVERTPKRLIVDKYGRSTKANGGRTDIATFLQDVEETLIVYGTVSDEAGNRDAADLLQEELRRAHSNHMIPIVTDATVTEEQLKTHHLLLVGRPSVNRITQRMRDAFPIRFGEQSFEVMSETYAHPKSAVIAAGVNPLNPRYAVTVVAGLCALSTYQAASQLDYGDFGAEVKVLPNGGREKKLVIPAPELIHEFGDTQRVSKAGPD